MIKVPKEESKDMPKPKCNQYNTKIDDNTLDFLKKAGAGGSKIYGGFGISKGQQAKALASEVEAVVAGSVFVRLITENKNNPDSLYKAVRAKAEELTGLSG